MIQVINNTRGIICIDVPQDRRQEEDPVGAVLASLDMSRPASTDDLLRTYLALEVGKHHAAAAEKKAHELAMKRAHETVDLLPEYQGKDHPKYVNRVPDEHWRKIERIPVIAARLASGDLRVVGYPQTYAPF